MAETALPARVARTPENLSIKTAEELEDFWRTILPDFVKIVDPENSGFLEDMYSDQILTHTDYESLVSGKDYMPRAQKTRKLWLVLSSYNLGLFRAKVAPRLLDSFAPIIPDRFFNTSDQCLVTIGTQSQCLRHEIQKRIRVDTMADLLCHHGCLSHEDYGTIISSISRNSTADWKIIFKAFAGKVSGVTEKLIAEVQELLERYNVPFPDNMADFLVLGFPCTCDLPEASPPDDMVSRDRQVMYWLERKLTTFAQRSPDSSLTRVDVSPDGTSLSSSFRSVSELDTVSLASNTDLSEEINTHAKTWVRLGTDSSEHHGSILSSTCTEVPDSRAECIPMRRLANANADTLIEVSHDREEKQALIDPAQVCARAPSQKRTLRVFIVFLLLKVKVWLDEFEQYYDDSFSNIVVKEWQLIKERLGARYSVYNFIFCVSLSKTRRLPKQFLKLFWRMVPVLLICLLLYGIMHMHDFNIRAALRSLFLCTLIILLYIVCSLIVVILSVIIIECCKIRFGMFLASLIMFLKMLVQPCLPPATSNNIDEEQAEDECLITRLYGTIFTLCTPRCFKLQVT